MSAKSGWPRVAFGDVVQLVRERSSDPERDGFERYVGLEHIEPGDLHVRRWGNVSDGTTFTNVFRVGQVLFGKRRAYQRKVAVADFDGVCSGDIYVFEPKGDELLPELLPFICQTDRFFEHAIGTSAGSLSPRTSWQSLAEFQFALPPVNEQGRIAEALAATKLVNDTMRHARDAGERSRKAFIVALFQSGTRQERRRSTPIGSLPESWDIAPLGTRYQVQLGKMISDAARRGSGQVPYIRNANVQWNRLELDDVATMAMSARECEKFLLQPGDILACEGRHVGKSALWRGEIPGATYQKALHRLRRLSDRDVPEYLLHCLQYYSWIGRFAVETGETTIPHLPAERFRAMLFPFPTRTEQAEIATAINNYDASMSAIEERIARTRGLLGQLIRPWNTQ
jgi:type I restriction enzyme S subunit